MGISESEREIDGEKKFERCQCAFESVRAVRSDLFGIWFDMRIAKQSKRAVYHASWKWCVCFGPFFSPSRRFREPK